MKNLIYYTSYNEEFSEYTNMSIHSLILRGNYTGDIIVFCDDSFINKFPDRVNKVIYSYPNNTLHPSFYRIFVLDSIYKNYDKILYIDSDTLIINDINKLFDFDSDLCYACEGTKLNLSKFCTWTTRGFTLEEYEKYKENNLINSGTFCFSTKIYDELMRNWKLLLDSRTKYEFRVDQAMFNLLIYSKIIPNTKSYNSLILMYWDTLNTNLKDTVLIHYNGPNYVYTKQQMRKKYEDILKNGIN